MNLKQGGVLVAGGSSGLGAACVRRLAAAGAGVLIADINPPREELAGELGDRVRFVRTDVTDEAEVSAAIAAARNAFGGLRGAVTCAGVIHADRILNREGAHALEPFRRVIEVNLIGSFNVARLAADAIRQEEPTEDGERGAIVMTSSVAAFEGQIGQAAYAASKGGVASLTLPLARDLSRYGIRVVSIAPGVFETPMMEKVSDAYRTALIENVPFPARLGNPEEFAALVEHIFENRYLNGSVLRLDGAIRMPPR